MGNRTRSLFHSSISGSGLLTLNPPRVQIFVSMLERWKVMKQRRPLRLLSHFLGEEQHLASLIMPFFSQDFSLLLYLVIFSRNLGPIYASSSIILPCFTPAYDYQRLHMIFQIKYTGILYQKRKTSIQSLMWMHICQIDAFHHSCSRVDFRWSDLAAEQLS